jgi:uncharacterized oligopeptide transporter (OPT) family protein
MTAAREGRAVARLRTEADLPLSIVIGGSAVIMVALWFLLQLSINPGHGTANAFAAVLIVIFGFVFVTVSSRITGLIGNSSNPISGMTIATLMATCLIFVVIGWTGGSWPAVALSVGGVVCIAAANAGATSQDLKTGYLVGATPWRQQLSLMVGALASVLVIGFTITKLNDTYTSLAPQVIEVPAMTPEMRELGTVQHAGASYTLINVVGSRTIPDGRYYYDAAERRIEFRQQPGIGSDQMPAPQATLMTTVINGILNQNLQWGLVLFGVFVVIVLELLGVRPLAFAVGMYLPISTTAPIFAGGVVRWLVEGRSKPTAAAHGESEVSSGSLTASGLIAGAALAGLLVVVPMDTKRALAAEAARLAQRTIGMEWGDLGARFWPQLAASDVFALVMFLVLAAFLYVIAKRKLEAA